MNKPVRLQSDAVDRSAFTAHEYCQMLEGGAFVDLRVELVAGELQKMMPTYLAHGEMNMTLAAKLFTAYAGSGLRLAIDLVIAIDEMTVRAADIAIVAPDAPERAIVPASQTQLLVEVADTSLGGDLGEKLADYARAGVSNYWVVDIVACVVHVMSEPAGEEYRKRSVVRFDDAMAVPGTDRTITID